MRSAGRIIALAGSILVLAAVASAALLSSGNASAHSTSGTISLVAYSTPRDAYSQLIPAFQNTSAGNGTSFQQSYGRDLLRRKGTADHWSALEQMWVAERAYRAGRGYYPWPNTARACGLI